MKKCCIFSMCVLFLLSVLVSPITTLANDAITFDSLWPTGTMSSVEGSGNVSYQNGVLTITKESGMTYAPIVSANIKTFLGDAAFASPYSAKFTMHVEIKIPAYSAATRLKAGMMIGAGVNGGGNLFQITDAEQTGVPRALRVQHHANVGTGAYATSALASGIDFVADQWIRMDVLVDLSAEQATFYINDNLIGAVDCRANGFGNAGWRIGFLGYKGVSFRNMKVMKGLVVPDPSASPSTMPSATPAVSESPSMTPNNPMEETDAPSVLPETTTGTTQQSSAVPTATSESGANPNTAGTDYSYMIFIAGILLLASVAFAIYRYRKNLVRGSEE